MAGDWIVWTKGLTDKREVRAIARKLNVDRRIVAACCMMFWEWVDSESRDGHIQGATMADIDEIVNLPGFAVSLIESEIGWLRQTDCGITIPNFKRHNGESAKKRAKDRTRKRQTRSHSNNLGRPKNVRKKTDKNRTREEKRREEVNNPPTPQGGRVVFDPKCVPLPESLANPRFTKAWCEWCEYRSSKRKKLSAKACEKQLEQLAKVGVGAAIAAIEKSIACDWQGLFPDVGEKPAASRCPTDEDLANWSYGG